MITMEDGDDEGLGRCDSGGEYQAFTVPFLSVNLVWATNPVLGLKSCFELRLHSGSSIRRTRHHMLFR